MAIKTLMVVILCFLSLHHHGEGQVTRNVGRFQEVFAWRQLVYNIDGVMLTEDRASASGLGVNTERQRRQAGAVIFDNESDRGEERDWNSQRTSTRRSWRTTSTTRRPDYPDRRATTTETNGWPDFPDRRTTTTERNRRPDYPDRRSTTTETNRWPDYPDQRTTSTTTETNRWPDYPDRSSTTTETNRWPDYPDRRSTTTETNRRPDYPDRRTTTTERNRRPTSTTESNRRRTSTTESNRRRTTTQRTATDDPNAFFIQYNNIPMGAERVGNRLFVTVPRRRYGVPSTLNYLDLTEDSNVRSPGLRPYPSIRQASELTSVYRTRADDCGRLWMVDTGVIEIPNNRQQVRPPAIVIYDLRTDRQILRYPFKNTDLVSDLTPTGLASITVDVSNSSCDSAYAYVPDLVTYGLIVFSLRDRDSWRLRHNFFSFDPAVGNLIISGQRFQWNDGIFSVTLAEPGLGGCRTAYFHAMVSTREFSVSTCVLQNRTASSDSNFWAQFATVGDRGADSHSTMHGYHAGSGAVFFANIVRDGVACWHTGSPLTSTAVQLLVRDSAAMAYPADLHITGDDVWVLTNSLPTWIYSRLDTNDYNFHIYRANIYDLISNTVCTGRPVTTFNRNGLPEDEEINIETNEPQ